MTDLYHDLDRLHKARIEQHRTMILANIGYHDECPHLIHPRPSLLLPHSAPVPQPTLILNLTTPTSPYTRHKTTSPPAPSSSPHNSNETTHTDTPHCRTPPYSHSSHSDTYNTSSHPRPRPPLPSPRPPLHPPPRHSNPRFHEPSSHSPHPKPPSRCPPSLRLYRSEP